MSLPRTRVDGTTTSPEAPRDDVLLDDAGHPRGRDVLPWVFAGASIVGYLGWPFVTGTDRATLTIVTVTTFFLASATHAWLWRGPRWTTGYLATALGIGWAVEAFGTATGTLFGSYHYTGALGPTLLDVPLLIPMAWAMTAYPCLLAVQSLVRSRWATALLGGYLLTTWDLFLDPQMVGEGYWVWHDPERTLPGIPGIPIENYLGWAVVTVAMMAVLAGLPRVTAPSEVPSLLMSWLLVSNVFANVVFFGRPLVALWGGVLMGAVVVPWWLRGQRRRRAARRPTEAAPVASAA
ncbi:MAG: carotenoid biosynthesis protein [Actinomycetales bacterium]|nr:carotenoid biosynthesis protein [Actinomycetales bacterium]